MAPTRKRENRENQYYNVGVQGRKTGIELPDTGIRDEYGMEPISNIFSSPTKSPPKNAGETVTESESMDIQESSIPELATSARIMRNSRTHLPPPKARSPIKTSLGSSPRRQSSMGPRTNLVNQSSSPIRTARTSAVSRVLDFQQEEESSLQETPALSGSGMRRGKRADLYEIASSPIRHTEMLEETIQEEIIATEDSVMMIDEVDEESDVNFENDAATGADAENLDGLEESEAVLEEAPVLPAKKGRKRKSAALEPSAEEEQVSAKSKKRATAVQAQEPETKKRGKKSAAAALVVPSRRSKRVSDITGEEPSTADASEGPSEQIQSTPVAPKPRGRLGRPPKAKVQSEPPAPAPAPAKGKQQKPAPAQEKENEEQGFKKPKAAGKTKKKVDTDTNTSKKQPAANTEEKGRLVDLYGNPVSKEELDKLSNTSAGSRFGRRGLSVFREIEVDPTKVTKRGRHRVPPVDFWSGERLRFDGTGNIETIVKAEKEVPAPHRRPAYRSKAKKRALVPIEEDEDDVEPEPWEEDEGVFVGTFNSFNPANQQQQLEEDVVAWAAKGIQPNDVKDKSFKFCKLHSTNESFLSWGFLELTPDQFKRSKSTGSQHLVFHVQTGIVMVKLLENEFVVRAGGVFHCPRGNFYSIRNVGTRTSRIFFAGGQKVKEGNGKLPPAA